MSGNELGGDPPCWAHLFDDRTEAADGELGWDGDGLVVELGAAVTDSGGAIWSLPHGGDLDANLVRLDPNAAIGEHINNDVDVLIYVQSGSGEVAINGSSQQVGPNHLALVRRTASRSVTAGPAGMTYLSVHRQRSALTIGKQPETTTAEPNAS